jgi:hypothetical protein
MIEAQYTRNVHKKLPSTVYAWKINDNYTIGVADAFYRRLNGKGTPTWAEYKYIKSLPKKPETIVKPKLSDKQKQFLKEAHNAGENAVVIIGYKSKGVLLHLDEIEGITKKSFCDRLQSYNDMAKTIEQLTRNYHVIQH